MPTIAENTIQKEAQRLARADGKQFARLSMAERWEYAQKAKAELEARSR